MEVMIGSVIFAGVLHLLNSLGVLGKFCVELKK
jgi:hypothetical protein